MKFLQAPRQPCAGLVLAAVAGILLAEHWPQHSSIALALWLAMLPLVLCTRASLAVYAYVAGGFFLAHSFATDGTPAQQLAEEIGPAPRVIGARGIVVSEPKTSASGFSTFLLQLNSINTGAADEDWNAQVFTRWHGAAAFGDELTLFAVAEPIAPPRNPGVFNQRAYLARRDVRTEFFCRASHDGTVLRHARGNWLMRAAQKSRRWMQAALDRGLADSPDVCGLVNGMVLGLRHEAPDDIEEPFQQTGTLHLFAVAGLHVGIIARLLWIAAGVARLSRKWATALIIPALLFYAAITGLHTSSVRAAVMAGALIGACFFDRRPLAVNSLALAGCVILAWDTNELFSVGFLLSFAVVLAIILGSDFVFQRLIRWGQPDPFLPPSLLSRARVWALAIWRGIARGLSVSLLAWVGSFALIWWFYHLVTPVSLLANLVVVPIAFFVLATGMVSLLAASFCNWLNLVFNNANWALAHAIFASVHLCARAPASHTYVEQPHWPDGAVASLTVLDLRAGGAAHLRAGGEDWMFDIGSERDYARVLREYLHARGVNRLAGLTLSHADSAHIGGAAAAIVELTPRTIIESGLAARSSVQKKLFAQWATTQIGHEARTAGFKVDLARNVTARLLFPPAGFLASAADDQALVWALTIGKCRLLLMSDSGSATENWLLTHEPTLRSDIIVKGQHRSGESGSPQFLDAVRPQLIVASAAEVPASERISDEWADNVAYRGIELLRQDETGAVEIRFFRDHWTAHPQLGGADFRSSSR